jgi:glycerophosphoryl diester phosphodiesterase
MAPGQVKIRLLAICIPPWKRYGPTATEAALGSPEGVWKTLSRLILKVVAVVLILLVVIYLVLVDISKPAPDHPFFSSDLPSPLVIAHRGGKGLWPENTLYAFGKAVGLGVDALEMDIHSTADGELVVIHDDTVDRTTDGVGPVNDLTLDELRALDAGYRWTPDDGASFPYRGKGISVPTLEEVFAVFYDKRLMIEIKQVEPSIAAPFCNMIRRFEAQDRVLVASFDHQALEEFRALCPEVASSISEDEMRKLYVFKLFYLGGIYSPTGNAIQAPEYQGDLRVITPRLVRLAHHRNMQVHAWTINDTYSMQRLLAQGVDGIISDYPNLMLELLGR